MTDLRTRIMDAWLEVNPEPRTEDEPEWQGPGTLRYPNYNHWRVAKIKLESQLAVGAYESAVIQFLVPEGPAWVLTPGLTEDQATASLGSRKVGILMKKGATPAEALLNAILAARETDQ